MRVAIGLDLGGTASRALVADAGGHHLGRGRAGGGNPVSHGVERAISAMIAAAREALDDAGAAPADLAGAFAGLAGHSLLAGGGPNAAAARDAYRAAWRGELGAGCELRIGPDVQAAFAAGTAEPDGTVLIGGTGAIAGRVEDGAVARMAGGWGWLLGDEGSGYWLGREAVRHLLAVGEGRETGGLLAESTARELGGATSKGDVVAAVGGRDPVALSGLAGLVSEAAQRGDPAAAAIADGAARLLADAAAAVRGGADDASPVVVTGGVAAGEGSAVAERLAGELGRRWPSAAVSRAGDGVAGAAWVALRGIGADAGAHGTLVG